MEEYRSEEEQVEALRRWWDDNGRSLLVAVVVALAAMFGWQTWRDHAETQREVAADIYQTMLVASQGAAMDAEQQLTVSSYAARLKEEFPGTTYAQFAALQLARDAVQSGDLEKAETELRWVLAKASRGSDVAVVSQLRLARVLAARGQTDQALAMLEQKEAGAYAAAYAVARGDVLFAEGRNQEAREAYASAQALTAVAAPAMGAGILDQKLESLSATLAQEKPPIQTESTGSSESPGQE